MTDYVDVWLHPDLFLGLEVETGNPAYTDSAASYGLRLGMDITVAVVDPFVDVTMEMGLALGVGLRVFTSAIPAPTDWTMPTAAVDADVLQSMRVSLATADGEYTVVDPAELADLVVNLTRKGGVDTGAMTLSRDARLELGDLDYGTACTVEYKGRRWDLWVSEASLTYDAASMSRPVTLLGWIMRMKEERDAFRRIYKDQRLGSWQTDQGHQASAYAAQWTVSQDENEIRLAANCGSSFTSRGGYTDFEALESPGSSCRAYYQLFGGLACDDRITDLDLRLIIGSHNWTYTAGWWYSVYGRASLNGPDLVLLARGLGPLSGWTHLSLDIEHVDDHPVRCVVVKAEWAGDSPHTFETLHEPLYQDQYDGSGDTMEAPPFCVRILKGTTVYASPLRRGVTIPGVVADIVKPWWPGEKFFCPDEAEAAEVEIDQLVFEETPKTRLDAFLEVDQMLDWDAEANKDSFTYKKPATIGSVRDDELYTPSLADPRFTGTITPSVDECWNGVRLQYTHANEVPAELILHGESEWLGDRPKCHVYPLPASIRSKAQAERIGARVLASGLEPPIAGAPHFAGTAPVASGEERDCLLMKPGELLQVTDAPRTFRRVEREISAVAIHPLTHTVDVELGPKSRKLEKFLARYAARGRT